MTTTPSLALKPEWTIGEIAVVGLARSGRAAALLLARAGARVYASDSARSPELEDTAVELVREKVDVELGAHDLDRLSRCCLVVASPGVPPDAPPFQAACEAGIDIVSEIEIGVRFLPDLNYIAITGTNGKTTTTSITGHLLKTLGHHASAAGNIGIPLTELALSRTPPDWAALEVSSFQLHDTPSIAPRVGVLTNLSANHLDRYDSVEAYYADKALLFRNATAASNWVTNADDPAVQAMTAAVPGMQARFSVKAASDAYLDRTHDMLVALGHPLVRRDELTLLGDHNVANALAASLAVMMADPAHRTHHALNRIREGLRTFRALEHRIETVGEYGGVTWINDSKSTNVASTIVAMRGMSRPTVLLLGGRHKGEPYTELRAELARTGRAVIAYGESAHLIQHDLDGVVPLFRLGSSFEDVVAKARELAQPGDVVLLSPACSSYDMFDNYEHRGAVFKQLADSGASR
ncbi:MAG TPA: UDP-N-acetylmuramoyl-L-alanine--D-glutamate ligase [Gemmatimonadaceae bacterium]|jgi:UDP-N-acetylmuramoylalanine--D-glutamate ligase|nr:UDP-N-acetylmuramoyl-L-alanine--D-glutamate ligase [Gemmatimonadaceae bacterium]